MEPRIKYTLAVELKAGDIILFFYSLHHPLALLDSKQVTLLAIKTWTIAITCEVQGMRLQLL